MKLRTAVIVPLVLFASCRESKPGSSATAPATQGAACEIVNDASAIAEHNRAVGLMGKFEYAPALEVFQSLAKEYPGCVAVRVNEAIATLNRQQPGDEEAALKILEAIVRADANNLSARYCTGLLRLYLQSPAEAVAEFRFVASADPKDAYAAYYVGQCLAQMRDYAGALEWYDKALAIDPHLRSGYYAKSQALRALKRDDQAQQMLDAFQRLASNPRARLVEFKYTRMGKKGEAQTIDLAQKPEIAPPQGPLFAEPRPLIEGGEQFKWKIWRADRPVSITACDIEMDGDIDVFIANCLDEGEARNAVCVNDGAAKFTLDLKHPLAEIGDVNAALWGDYDNDGLTDVYLCRRGTNHLWRQPEKSAWSDVTAQTGTANGELDTVDGALVDFDHDGDLDIFCVNADGPNELSNNNMDDTFRPIAPERGIAGNGKGSRQVLPVDLDGDRDLDIIVINNDPPHDVWVNDRLWEYRDAIALQHFKDADINGAVVSGTAADGSVVLWTVTSSGDRTWWELSAQKVHTPTFDRSIRTEGTNSFGLIVLADLDGAQDCKLITPAKKGWSALALARAQTDSDFSSDVEIRGLETVIFGEGNGAAVVALPSSGQPLIWAAGPGRFSYAAVSFTGREVTSDNRQIRSNASGIGVHYAARIDSTWVAGRTLRTSSGPGQSLQPVAIGLGGHDKIDFLSIDWSDGVFQTEIDLNAGEHHTIAETQRQISSCPVIFVWNGKEYEFFTDALGVGGIGYMVAPHEYAPARPWEKLLLPEGMLQARGGQFEIKLTEPMEEACYLDAARLAAYDLPPDWKMTLDERMNILGPEPTGEARFFVEEVPLARAINQRGEDVTSTIVEADLIAAPLGEIDGRFIGRLKSEHVLMLEFDSAIDAVLSRERLLVIDGWIEYPYSQTMFAAWQAGADYRAPTIEALGDDGEWKIVLEQFGYPAGMPRQMSVRLEDLPAGTTKLRIRTNQEIYFDRIAIAYSRECDPPTAGGQAATSRVDLPLRFARVAETGFAKRTTGPQRQPHYDYNDRVPLWDTRHQRGFYTEFGEMTDLVRATDDALATFGPGEEVHLAFDAAALPPLQPGWTRRFVLELDGWCKDMDLFTKDGETIEPLPSRGTQARPELHQRFNTRFEAGR